MLMLQNGFFFFYPSLKLLFFIFLYCMFSNFLRLVTVLLDFSHFFTILVLLPKFFGTYFIARYSITGLNVFCHSFVTVLIVLQGEELYKQWLLSFPSFILCYSYMCTM